MMKVLIILLFGLVLEAMGVVLVSQGLHEIGELRRISVGGLGRLFVRGVTNTYMLLGVLCLVLFFGCLLYLLSQEDVSLIWPLTSLGFVLTVLAARFIRHEEVTALRWGGVALIVVGATLVAWSEQKKKAEEGASYESEHRSERVVAHKVAGDPDRSA
jgi:drug/metabolite transporter (DMT)-like permease